MRHLVLGTAGHIDHGKTALVRALTGTDTDRLPEEKRRGITIDLGFARLALPGDIELGIVDVPGHEAFVRNMLAGATGIDLALLVIAADEGVMPQTREHLDIIELLGIRRGIIVLTKTDLVEPEWLELVREEARALLAPTALAAAPIIGASARTGAGLDELRAALARAAADTAARTGDDLFRMPIDRVFTVRGTGTVVTGTVWSGSLRRDAQLRIEPAGATARVRGLQHHGVDCDVIAAGERAAVALVGIDRHALVRGDTLVTGAGWAPAQRLTVRLAVLPGAAPVQPRQRVRVHLGTGEVLARIALLSAELPPGAEEIVQLRLERPLLARAADCFVIRSFSPVRTIAGGVVLEPLPPKRKRLGDAERRALDALADPDRSLAALLELAGHVGVARAELPIRTGLAPQRLQTQLHGAPPDAHDAHDALNAHDTVGYPTTDVADRVVATGHVDACAAAILDRLHRFHRDAPLEEGMDREALRQDVARATHADLVDVAILRLLQAGELAGRGTVLARADFTPTAGPAHRQRLDRLAAVFAAAGLQPPELHELPADLAADPTLHSLIRFLERDGVLVRIAAGRWAHATAIADCIAGLHSHLPPDQPLTVAQFRDVLNLSRKHLIPLLEFLDRTGTTDRTGDTRTLRRTQDQRTNELTRATPATDAAES
jgi:selenocysteine-specific elongation factor